MRPFSVDQLKKLQKGMRGEEVLFLHSLLNYHLGPPDDQLPMEGAGAMDFGPRTEAKVKRFQQINKIDIGTTYFMDGVVGSHTWAVLNERQQVTVNIVATPVLKLTPPTMPSQPGSFLPPAPIAIPVPRLTLDNIQLQAGEQGTFPFASTRKGDNKGVTVAHSLQLIFVLLKKKDKDAFHNEIQFGPAILSNRGPGADSKTDFGFLGVLNQANMPGSGGRFNWSVQEQLALVKSLSNRSASAQFTALLSSNLSLIKNKAGDDVLQATAQGGVVLEADPPTKDNNHLWTLKAGVMAFWGLTGTFNLF